MQFKELIVGQRYILKSPRGLVATFDGKHGSGLLALADGTHFYGGTDYLRFIADVGDGERRTILLPTGADVEEAEATKLVREQQEHAKKERQAAAMEQGVALLARLGYTVNVSQWHQLAETEVCIKWPAETMDELQVDGITIGKLKSMLERAKAQWPHLAALTTKEAQ